MAQATPTSKEWKPGAVAQWLGLVEIALALGLVVLVTVYHGYDDSSMAAVMWLYSFPVALFFFALPGLLLRRTRWVGWVSQVLPLSMVAWVCVALLGAGP